MEPRVWPGVCRANTSRRWHAVDEEKGCKEHNLEREKKETEIWDELMTRCVFE